MRRNVPRLVLLLVLLSSVLGSGCGRRPAPLTDDFSDPASGWGSGGGAGFTRGYVNGRYQIEVDTPGLFVWTLHSTRYRDVSLSLTAIADGNPDNHYGLICRADEEGFYYFAVSADGYYGIFRSDREGHLTAIDGVGMHFTPLLETGENHLRAECNGHRLALYINGERAGEPVEDTAFDEGLVGFGAGLNAKPGSITIYFDDFEATPLGGE